MPEKQRTVLLMAYFEGLTLEKISARIELPVGIVRELFRRGLAMLSVMRIE
jgi:DNA-directed RNA polymerase specialized sigma24 family protein